MEHKLLKQIYKKYKTKEIQREELEAFLRIKYSYTFDELLNYICNLVDWGYIEELKNQDGIFNMKITSKGENIIKEDFTLFSKIKNCIHNKRKIKNNSKQTVNKINNWFNINI